jgi:hypothetical protein
LQTGLNELEQPAPFSSIGTFSEILLGDPKPELAQRKNFLGIISEDALEQVDGAGRSDGIAVVPPVQGGNK